MAFEVKVFISGKALKKLKDKYIRGKKEVYNAIILRILNAASEFGDPRKYPSEVIGKFFVSPQARTKERVAWTFEIKDKVIIVYIEDLLYHISRDEYTDNWISKVRDNKINLTFYKESGHISYAGL